MKAKISNINFLSLCRIDAMSSMCHFDAMSTYTNSPDPTEATIQAKPNAMTPPRQLWDNFSPDPTEATIRLKVNAQLKTSVPHRGNHSSDS